jgi:dihydropyrimidinase
VSSDWDLIVRNGSVVTPDGVIDGDVAIRDGQIGAVGPVDGGGRELDATECYVVPGGIDPHLHVATPTDPGIDPLIEHIDVASSSALLGGTTSICVYVRGETTQSLAAAIDAEIESGEKTAATDFAINAICRPTDDPYEVVHAGLARGVTTFKAMLAYKRKGLMLDDRTLFELMTAVAAAGAQLLVHPENGVITELLEEREYAAHTLSPASYLRSAPGLLEAEGMTRVAYLSVLAGCDVLFVHLTSKEAVRAADWIRTWPEAARFAWETQPHYLNVTNSEVLERGALGKVGPPLRDADDVEAVRAALTAGVISHLSSDHAPRNRSLKLAAPDILAAPYGGTTGTQLLMPLAYSLRLPGGPLPIERVVELTSTNAARLYGLYPRKGAIRVGSDADLAVIPLTRKSRPIDPDTLHGPSDYTLFRQVEVDDFPRHVVRAGRIAVANGVLADVAPARYLHRKPQKL